MHRFHISAVSHGGAKVDFKRVEVIQFTLSRRQSLDCLRLYFRSEFRTSLIAHTHDAAHRRRHTPHPSLPSGYAQQGPKLSFKRELGPTYKRSPRGQSPSSVVTFPAFVGYVSVAVCFCFCLLLAGCLGCLFLFVCVCRLDQLLLMPPAATAGGYRCHRRLSPGRHPRSRRRLAF